MNNHTIKVDHLTFKYNQNTVLKNINCSFEKGKIYGLIGPNGSGKTTLLKNIAKLLEPKKRTVFINETDILKIDIKNRAKMLSYVPQNTNIDFDFSVQDIVLMGRSPYLGNLQEETKEDIEICIDAMKTAGIYTLRNRSIKALSGGELQRTIVARALAQETEIILLDEPVSQLDIHHQLAIMETISKLAHDNNMTVITVLHDLNLAAEYCDLLYMMRQGELYCQGTPKEVLTYENIEDVYDVVCLVYENKISKRPHIIPIRSK